MGKSKVLAIKSTKEKVLGLKWYKLFHQKLYWLRKKQNIKIKGAKTDKHKVLGCKSGINYFISNW